MRFVFIHRERDCFPITALCRVLRVSCSGYHAWLGRVPCARKARDQRLAVEIAAVFKRSRETYGSPRVRIELVSGGLRVGRNRIARIMHDSSLFARKKRSFTCTTDSRTTKRIAPNVLARSFTAAAPNRKWVTDVKAIRAGEGWMYLAARGRINGLLHHSDRGSPYGSDLYTDRLCALHVQPSMSGKGDCWDNAVAESFFSTPSGNSCASAHSRRTARRDESSVNTSTSSSIQSGGIQPTDISAQSSSNFAGNHASSR